MKEYSLQTYAERFGMTEDEIMGIARAIDLDGSLTDLDGVIHNAKELQPADVQAVIDKLRVASAMTKDLAEILEGCL